MAAPTARAHPHRAARRRALDILYQADMTGESLSLTLEEWEASGQDVPGFAAELVRGVEEAMQELDRLIGGHSEGWTVARMAAVDRSILRLACYELLHRPDVPQGAAIDEAVRAAKRLSTEESGRFVNGILGKIARERKPTRSSSRPKSP